MQAEKGAVKERMMLELLMVSDIGLSPDVIERNWNVDQSVVEELLRSLESKGYVENLGDLVFVPTEKAYDYINSQSVVRSSSAFPAEASY